MVAQPRPVNPNSENRFPKWVIERISFLESQIPLGYNHSRTWKSYFIAVMRVVNSGTFIGSSTGIMPEECIHLRYHK